MSETLTPSEIASIQVCGEIGNWRPSAAQRADWARSHKLQMEAHCRILSMQQPDGGATDE